jgi:hypothetical protein
LPAFCIAAAQLIEYLSSNRISKNKVWKLLSLPSLLSSPIVIISAIGIFGLITTTILITSNVNLSYFNIYSRIVQQLPDSSISNSNNNNNPNNNNNKVTIIGSHWWIWNAFWIPQYVFHKNFDFIDPHFDPLFKKPIETQKVLFITDRDFMYTLSKNPFIIIKSNNGGIDHIERIGTLYRSTKPIAYVIDSIGPYNTSQYPYTNMGAMVLNERRSQG